MAFREQNAAKRALNEVRELRRAREGRDRIATQQQQQSASKEAALTRGFEARQAKLDRRANIAGQRMASKSQLELAKFDAESEKGLHELKRAQKAQQVGLPRFKTSGKGDLTTKNRFDIRKGLNAEFYGDNPAGEALREHYGEDGFGMFATQMEQRYQSQQQPGLAALPQQPDQVRAFKDPATGVWKGGEVEQSSILPSMEGVGSPGQLPVRQPIEQPTGTINATLPPSPQSLSSLGVSIPDEFTEANRPERSRVWPRPPAFDPEESRGLKLQPIKNLLSTNRLYRKPEPKDWLRLNVNKYNSKAGRKNTPQTKGQRLSSRGDKLKRIRDMFYLGEK